MQRWQPPPPSTDDSSYIYIFCTVVYRVENVNWLTWTSLVLYWVDKINWLAWTSLVLLEQSGQS